MYVGVFDALETGYLLTGISHLRWKLTQKGRQGRGLRACEAMVWTEEITPLKQK